MSEQATTILFIIIGLLVTIILALAGFAFRIWMRSSQQKIELSNKNSEEIEKMKARIAELEFPVKLLWANKQREFSEALHHPHAKDHEMDELLEKLNKIDITPDEVDRLKVLLLARSKDMSDDVSEEERIIAARMAGVMNETVLEQLRNLRAMQEHFPKTKEQS